MAQLPPKIPPAMNQNWPTPFPPHQRMPSLTNIPDPSLPSATTATPTTAQQQPSWMEEFLDFSSTRRGSHRRSMSDSIAFLETPLLLDECRTNSSASPIGGNGHHPHMHVSSAAIINSNGFDRLDDEQLMSMFSDDHISVDDHLQPALPPASNPSTSSDQNSDKNNNNNNMSLDQQHQQQPQPKIEPGEVDSSCNDNSKNNSPLIVDQDGNQEDPRQLSSNGNTSPNDHSGPIDPKRVKRILANRQSAQRSRVRKLHYISELERSVTTLQTEVSALSPRVAFLDHQRLVLNVDNSALKQRIAALAQDKIFKDAHQEALKKEIERLRQIYHHQQQQQQQQQQQNTRTKEMSRRPANIAVAPPTSDANMVCTEKEQLMA